MTKTNTTEEIRIVNPNFQFRNDFAREQGLSRFQAINLIAERAEKVASLSNCTFMGINKRGATFCVVIHDSDSSVLTPYRSFLYETVIDSPNEVIIWARETRKMHTPVNSWPTILNNVSAAWFGG